jgi:hypothetical protein
MNDFGLRFFREELSRLRALVAAVGEGLGMVPGAVPPDEDQTPKRAPEITWANLVKMLALGTEPEMRPCPECHHPCMLAATRCAHCWASLSPAISRAAIAA